MAQYIDKSALVAEIEKLKLCTMDEHMNFYSAEAQGEYNTLSKLESFLDTLEVKKIDLDGEIKEVQRHYKTIEEYEGYPCTMYANNIEWIAKHFFELGMSVSNKVQKG